MWGPSSLARGYLAAPPVAMLLMYIPHFGSDGAELTKDSLGFFSPNTDSLVTITSRFREGISIVPVYKSASSAIKKCIPSICV